jgi:hypothetical protein
MARLLETARSVFPHRWPALARHGVVPASSPEILEPIGSQLGVANRMLNVLVPEIGLQSPHIMTGIGQGEAAAVPQHVRVDRERHSSPFANPGKQAMKCLRRHWSTTLRAPAAYTFAGPSAARRASILCRVMKSVPYGVYSASRGQLRTCYETPDLDLNLSVLYCFPRKS